MALNRGLAQGLSVVVDYDSQIRDLQQQDQVNASIRAEKQRNAYLFGHDLEFGKANNKWDGPMLNEFTEKRVKEMGAYIQENPDWSYDPMKYGKVSMMKRELRDNPIVQRASRFSQQAAAYQEYANDPKNSMFINDLEPYRKQIDNYLNTGSIDGVYGNDKEFMFTPPHQGVDSAEVIRNHFNDVNARGIAIWGDNLNRQYVTQEDMYAAAYSLATDNSINGRTLQREWAELGEEGQKVFGGDMARWIVTRGKAHVQEDKFIRRSEGGSGSGKGVGYNPYNEQLFKPAIVAMARGVNDPVVQVSPGVLSGAVTNRNGGVEMRDAVMVKSKLDQNGQEVVLDRMPLPYLGEFQNAAETGRARYKTVPDENGKPVNIDRVELEVSTELSAQQIQDMLGEDIIDVSWYQGSPDEPNDFEIKPEYRRIFQKTGKLGEDGTQMLRMNVWLPAPNNLNLFYNNKQVNKLKGTAPDN